MRAATLSQTTCRMLYRPIGKHGADSVCRVVSLLFLSHETGQSSWGSQQSAPQTQLSER
jgi:hypothetical protein